MYTIKYNKKSIRFEAEFFPESSHWDMPMKPENKLIGRSSLYSSCGVFPVKGALQFF